MHFSTSQTEIPNQFMFRINRNMILVTVKTFAVLFRPPSIDIFLTLLVFAPHFRLLSILDLFIFFTVVALYGHSYNTGIYDQTFLSPKSMVIEIRRALNVTHLPFLPTLAPHTACGGDLS